MDTPNTPHVAGSGVELTNACLVVSPGIAPEFGATMPVKGVVVKNVEPNAPPGPSCSGVQLIEMLLRSLCTLPPLEVPKNVPTAPSVTSVMTRSKVKAPKVDPTPMASVEHVGQASKNVPRLRKDGVPVMELPFGVKVRVAA